ncbi:hypothetical protein [Actinomadura rubrisoli]|uniref:hypothetical protein n=1 Tax=Actinomadura rubrisoli TaxID=2530368 RepID=UPI001404565B|nr:hypothetical protein [Actinomadura rubrisoli]
MATKKPDTAEKRDIARDEALRAALEQMSTDNLTTTEGIRVDIVRDDIDTPHERDWGIA